MTGIHRDTIMRLMVRVGNACEKFMDATMRGKNCNKIQVDEIWTFVGKKQHHLNKDDNPHKKGDFWTWVALDADTKLVPTYKVGKRDGFMANQFIRDLSSRLQNKVQLSQSRFYNRIRSRISEKHLFF
jgi:IS1 family transposase